LLGTTNVRSPAVAPFPGNAVGVGRFLSRSISRSWMRKMPWAFTGEDVGASPTKCQGGIVHPINRPGCRSPTFTAVRVPAAWQAAWVEPLGDSHRPSRSRHRLRSHRRCAHSACRTHSACRMSPADHRSLRRRTHTARRLHPPVALTPPVAVTPPVALSPPVAVTPPVALSPPVAVTPPVVFTPPVALYAALALAHRLHLPRRAHFLRRLRHATRRARPTRGGHAAGRTLSAGCGHAARRAFSTGRDTPPVALCPPLLWRRRSPCVHPWLWRRRSLFPRSLGARNTARTCGQRHQSNGQHTLTDSP